MLNTAKKERPQKSIVKNIKSYQKKKKEKMTNMKLNSNSLEAEKQKFV